MLCSTHLLAEIDKHDGNDVNPKFVILINIGEDTSLTILNYQTRQLKWANFSNPHPLASK